MSDDKEFLSTILAIGRDEESRQYPNGRTKHKYRTDEESIALCGAPMGYGFDALSQTTKMIYEYPCGRVDPKKGAVCPKCVARRKDKRAGEFCYRVDSALSDGNNLFVYRAKDSRDMGRVQRQAARKGYAYIGFPAFNDGDERIVIFNGPLSGSEMLPDREIKQLVIGLSGIINGRVSGKLGKGTPSPTENTLSIPSVWYEYNKSIISRALHGELEATAIMATSEMPLDTDDEIVELVRERHSIMLDLIRVHDPRARMFDRKEVRVNPEQIRKSIYTLRMIESGSSRMVEPETRDALEAIKRNARVQIPNDNLSVEEEFALMGLPV